MGNRSLINITGGGSLWTQEQDTENIYRLDGNVGIGTSTPTAKLHIVNQSKANSFLEFKNNGDLCYRNTTSCLRLTENIFEYMVNSHLFTNVNDEMQLFIDEFGNISFGNHYDKTINFDSPGDGMGRSISIIAECHDIAQDRGGNINLCGGDSFGGYGGCINICGGIGYSEGDRGCIFICGENIDVNDLGILFGTRSNKTIGFRAVSSSTISTQLCIHGHNSNNLNATAGCVNICGGGGLSMNTCGGGVNICGGSGDGGGGGVFIVGGDGDMGSGSPDRCGGFVTICGGRSWEYGGDIFICGGNADFGSGERGGHVCIRTGNAAATPSNSCILLNHNVNLVTTTGRIDLTATSGIQINSSLRIVSGGPATGRVLTSDANGNATWQAPPSAGDVDLGVSVSTNQVTITNTGGNSAIIPEADAFDAGVLTSEEQNIGGVKYFLDGIVLGDKINFGVPICADIGQNVLIIGEDNSPYRLHMFNDTSSFYMHGDDMYFYIGDTLPTATLNNCGSAVANNRVIEIGGRLKINCGNPSAGRVLTSDANGYATWQDPSSANNPEITIDGNEGIVGGGSFTLNQLNTETITLCHSTITTQTDTASSNIALGGTFQTIESLNILNGHVVDINVSNITLSSLCVLSTGVGLSGTNYNGTVARTFCLDLPYTDERYFRACNANLQATGVGPFFTLMNENTGQYQDFKLLNQGSLDDTHDFIPSSKTVKDYVDALGFGLNPLQAVLATSSTNINVSQTGLPNITIDGRVIAQESIIAITPGGARGFLLINQTNSAENGIYVLNSSGNIVRRGDVNTFPKFYNGFVNTDGGDTNIGNSYYFTTPPTGTINSDPINIVLFFSNPSQISLSNAGSGTGVRHLVMTKVGNEYPIRGVASGAGVTATLNNTFNRIDISTNRTQHNEWYVYKDIATAQSIISTLTAPNFILSSDVRLKENIQPINNDLLDINYKTFNLKTDETQVRYGVIAQEIEEKYPEFVNEDEMGYKTVNYIDLLVKEVSYLKNKVKELEDKLNNNE